MNFWQITKKDLRLLERDRRTLFILVALPLVFISIVGLSTGQLLIRSDSNQVIRIAVINRDRGELSARVVAQMERRGGLKLVHLENDQDAEKQLDVGEYSAVWTIGPEFGERVEALSVGDILDPEAGKLAPGLPSLDMQVISRASLVNSEAIVRQLVFADTLRTIAPEVAGKNRLAAQFIERARKRLQEEQSEEPQHPATTSTPALTASTRNHTKTIYQVLVPSYTVMFVFFLVNLMARSFISERDLGTLSRLRMAPVTRTGLLCGKTIPFVMISLIQTSLLLIAGRVLFDMTWGTRPWLLLPVMFCTSLSAAALGLWVATLVRTDSQVSAYGNFLVITLAGISGCLMPRQWQPVLMQQVGLATPHAWALIAYDQILQRTYPDPWIVGQCSLVLLAFATGFFFLGWRRFRALG